MHMHEYRWCTYREKDTEKSLLFCRYSVAHIIQISACIESNCYSIDTCRFVQVRVSMITVSLNYIYTGI